MSTGEAIPMTEWSRALRKIERRIGRLDRQPETTTSVDELNALRSQLEELSAQFEELQGAYETLASEHDELSNDLLQIVDAHDELLLQSSVDALAWERGLKPEQAELLHRLADVDPDAILTEDGLDTDALVAAVDAALEQHGERIGYKPPPPEVETDGQAAGKAGATAPKPAAPPGRQGSPVTGRTAASPGTEGLFVVTRQQASDPTWKSQHRDAFNAAAQAGTLRIAEEAGV